MRWKFILGLLTTCAVLMSMSYTMLIPFLPMYLIQDLGVVKADVDMWSGAIFAITFLVSGIMAPIWGALADKKSRKLMALRAGFCLAITYFLGGLVTNPWELLGVGGSIRYAHGVLYRGRRFVPDHVSFALFR